VNQDRSVCRLLDFDLGLVISHSCTEDGLLIFVCFLQFFRFVLKQSFVDISKEWSPGEDRILEIKLAYLFGREEALLRTQRHIYKAVDIIVLQLIGLNLLFACLVSYFAGFLDTILQKKIVNKN